jgi:hypothetical protein
MQLSSKSNSESYRIFGGGGGGGEVIVIGGGGSIGVNRRRPQPMA